MYPKLWEASGIPYPQLLDRLIELALERYREKSRTRFTYLRLATSFGPFRRFNLAHLGTL
jgi:nucleoside-diphosphate-sugar epimerase